MALKVLAAAALLCTIAIPAHAEDEGLSVEDVPHVTIVGTATADVKPDIAVITLGVVSQRPTAREAATETARKAATLVESAKAAGVADADIRTQTLALSQNYDDLHDPQGRYIGRKANGFSAENIVTIKVRDLGKAGVLAQSLIDSGANRLDGIAFSVEHPEPILDRLVGEAVKRAKAQAEIAAQAAGMKLGRALLIAKPGDGGGMDVARPSAMRLQAKAAASAAMPVEAGTDTFAQSVEVTFALQ